VPEEITEAMQMLPGLLTKMGINVLVQNGWEADDLIATACHELAARDVQSIIFSQDKARFFLTLQVGVESSTAHMLPTLDHACL
jgi:5'-3' exonuclease, N-terminal resolvase-like domain